MSKEIDPHSSQYDSFLLIGDFTEEAIPTEETMKSFCLILKTYQANLHTAKAPPISLVLI